MKQLSLDNLRTFVHIIELGSFHKAGDVLGRSQPAISLQMKKLEGELGRKLFSKVGQSYQANKDGEWLYQQAKQMLSINDDIFRELNAQQTLRGRLRFGIPSEFASTLLPSIVGEFSQRYPDVSLDVTSSLSRQLLSKNQRSEFDLILALVDDAPDSDGEILLEDDLVWVGDASRKLNKDSLSLVLAPEGCVYRSRVISQLKQQTNAWKITYTHADLYGLMAAMKQGLGITALAKSSLPNELSIIKDRRLPPLGKIKICLFNQDTQHPQVSKTLSEYIRARIS
ncbi:LysR family transcriptional regulator [Glaciecola sp. XM2]|uniref:LysR family transcriptional regulator n=1 Tax=Glaciecola sp. XM2 TaxID=1914931 RepID=UPI001BDE6D06|nr:LysR family transcriptional regulator [Glaciecola sp. XM2]MBT1450556.1 LysR family transcriptional regulator [Glaciecola sp. XM2]